MSSSTATYSQQSIGICYRLAPSRLGFYVDPESTVTSVDPQSNVPAAGLQEGDEILSLQGIPVKESGKALLKVKPGEEVKIVWMRPGVGRMEGVVKTLPNPPKHLEIPDSIPLPEKGQEDSLPEYP